MEQFKATVEMDLAVQTNEQLSSSSASSAQVSPVDEQEERRKQMLDQLNDTLQKRNSANEGAKTSEAIDIWERSLRRKTVIGIERGRNTALPTYVPPMPTTYERSGKEVNNNATGDDKSFVIDFREFGSNSSARKLSTTQRKIERAANLPPGPFGNSGTTQAHPTKIKKVAPKIKEKFSIEITETSSPPPQGEKGSPPPTANGILPSEHQNGSIPMKDDAEFGRQRKKSVKDFIGAFQKDAAAPSASVAGAKAARKPSNDGARDIVIIESPQETADITVITKTKKPAPRMINGYQAPTKDAKSETPVQNARRQRSSYDPNKPLAVEIVETTPDPSLRVTAEVKNGQINPDVPVSSTSQASVKKRGFTSPFLRKQEATYAQSTVIYRSKHLPKD